MVFQISNFLSVLVQPILYCMKGFNSFYLLSYLFSAKLIMCCLFYRLHFFVIFNSGKKKSCSCWISLTFIKAWARLIFHPFHHLLIYICNWFCQLTLIRAKIISFLVWIFSVLVQLEEAIAFVKENARKLLNVETVALYPVSARSALEAKLSDSFDVLGNYSEHLGTNSDWKISSFYELEKYLYGFLDGSTATGVERMKLKLGTPLRIAEKLLYSCQKFVRAECQEAKKDLSSVDELLSSVEECSRKMKSESISWERQVMSQVWGFTWHWQIVAAIFSLNLLLVHVS